jgi:hypothetical protein
MGKGSHKTAFFGGGGEQGNKGGGLEIMSQSLIMWKVIWKAIYKEDLVRCSKKNKQMTRYLFKEIKNVFKKGNVI